MPMGTLTGWAAKDSEARVGRRLTDFPCNDGCTHSPRRVRT